MLILSKQAAPRLSQMKLCVVAMRAVIFPQLESYLCSLFPTIRQLVLPNIIVMKRPNAPRCYRLFLSYTASKRSSSRLFLQLITRSSLSDEASVEVWLKLAHGSELSRGIFRAKAAPGVRQQETPKVTTTTRQRGFVSWIVCSSKLAVLSVVMVCAVWSLVEAGLGGRSYNINSQQPFIAGATFTSGFLATKKLEDRLHR